MQSKSANHLIQPVFIQPVFVSNLPTATEIENWLVSNLAVAAELPREEISLEEPITSLGVESLVLFSLAGDLANWLGKDISATLLWEYPTIRELSAHLSQLLQQEIEEPTPLTSLVSIHPQGTRPPLYLVHEVGGTVWCYRAMASHMEADQPLYGFELPKPLRKSDDTLRIEELAALYVAELRAHQPNGPYFLGGFSVGGVIALEMARQLREQNQQVGLLAIIDTYFPGLTLRSPSLPRRVSIHMRYLRDLEGAQRTDYVTERVKKLRGVIPSKKEDAASKDDLKKKWQEGNTVVRLHRAFTGYQVEPYQGAITLLSARTRTLVGDEIGAWRAVAQGGVTQLFVPGVHGSITAEPQVRHLAARLTQCLKQAQISTD